MTKKVTYLTLKIIACIALLLMLLSKAVGQVTLPGTQVTSLYSEIIDQQYELHISFPRGYETSKEGFGVAYILDAQWDFPLIYSIYGEQYYDGFVPPLILVGITWGGEGDDPNVLRVRDFTPTPVNGSGGGADQFLTFLQEELTPFLEDNFKVNASSRTLMGSSLGGLFTLYAALKSEGFFHHYIPTSPAIEWDNGVLIAQEKTFYQNEEKLKGNLYSAVGGLEPGAYSINSFMETLKEHHSELNIEWKTLEGIGHSGCKAEGNTRGLQFVNQRPVLRLPPHIMDRYTGIYTREGGEEVRIAISRNQLFFITSYGLQYKLVASATDQFYVPGIYFNLEFTKNGFNLERFSGSTAFDKK